MHTAPTLTQLCGRVDDLLARRPGRRVVIGVVGPPGSGKTTFAEALVGALQERTGVGVAHVPMDGFHLADAELRRLGRSDRKGAPDTFDVAGYAALLERLHDIDETDRAAGTDRAYETGRADESGRATETVWAPSFDREIEQPIAGSIPVDGQVRVVVTEGNYLLLDQPAWRRARQSLDEVWFCDLDDDTRRERLVARHVRFGKTPAEATAWVNGPDERNAELIRGTRPAADLLVREQVDLVTPTAP